MQAFLQVEIIHLQCLFKFAQLILLWYLGFCNEILMKGLVIKFLLCICIVAVLLTIFLQLVFESV